MRRAGDLFGILHENEGHQHLFSVVLLRQIITKQGQGRLGQMFSLSHISLQTCLGFILTCPCCSATEEAGENRSLQCNWILLKPSNAEPLFGTGLQWFASGRNAFTPFLIIDEPNHSISPGCINFWAGHRIWIFRAKTVLIVWTLTHNDGKPIFPCCLNMRK